MDHNDLRVQADEILNNGIAAVLDSSSFNYVYTGSYAYDLMTWRDIDIHVDIDTHQESDFFALGDLLRNLPGVWSVTYKRKFDHMSDEEMMQQWYLGVKIFDKNNKQWKIDISAFASKIYNKAEIKNKEMQLIDDAQRSLILEAKKSMMKKARVPAGVSMKIYDAVITQGISSAQQVIENISKKN